MKQISMLSRILYVALTRAKEKLICIDCMKRAGARVRDLAAVGSYPAEPEAVASARALGDWLLLPLLQSVQAEPIRRWAGLDAEHLQDAVGWEVFLWENPTRQTAVPSAAPVPAQRAGEELPFDAAQLDWVYPHAASAVIPSKVTATQLECGLNDGRTWIVRSSKVLEDGKIRTVYGRVMS